GGDRPLARRRGGSQGADPVRRQRQAGEHRRLHAGARDRRGAGRGSQPRRVQLRADRQVLAATRRRRPLSTPSMAVLIIMDGLALNPSTRGNAVAAARTPVLDRLMAAYPMSRLLTSGRDVGLMDGQMGDSNVGHLNLGAGRIVKQYVLRILDAIDDGSFFENPVLIQAVDGVKARGDRKSTRLNSSHVKY